MGKKKITKKTKELSVAIGESSSIGEESQQTPRKRGRPRKIVEKSEEEQAAEGNHQDFTDQTEPKKAKTSEEAEEEEGKKELMREVVATSFSVRETNKEEGQSEERELIKEQPRRSRARRKSKPRKSS